MKVLLYVVLAVVAFVAAVVGATAVTGNLSQENLKRLFAKESPQPTDSGLGRVDAFVQQLKDREAELDRREKDIEEGGQRLAKRQADLEALRSELLAIQTQIQDSLKTADEGHQERLAEVAANLSKMKAANAVEVLQNWPKDDIVEILRLISDRQRVKILDAMAPSEATLLLQALQKAKI